MALTDLFARLAAALFSGQTADPADAVDPALLDDAVEAIVESIEPRMRLAPRYRARLAPVALRTIRLMRSLAPALQGPTDLLRAAWSTDAHIHAFFATADEVPVLLDRSEAVRSFFDDPANAQHASAYCLLGMQRQERRVFASALVDGELRRDVARTTIGFANHRLLAASGEPMATRRLVGQEILGRMAALVLERVVATRARVTELDVRKATLATRLRMLKLRGASLRELAAGESDPSQEIAAIERELKTTVADHLEVKASLATLDYSIEQTEQVLGSPEQHLGLDIVEMRVDNGYKLDAGSGEAGAELRLSELWIGPDLRAVVTLVRIPRDAMPPRRDRFADAARHLS